MSPSRNLPDCWGHRGASAKFPENTLASFEAAILDGAEGIESDVHVSKDDVVLMFHDPDLSRTTDYTGTIRDKNWFGDDGMQHARTRKEGYSKHAIPTFAETISLLMLPGNQHVKFNIDVKVYNDPSRLFRLMHEIISAQPDWEKVLAPRLVLGLWHPKFISMAKEQLPYCRRAHIGFNPYVARKYFWESCDAFSMDFACLTTMEGQRFRKECQAAGKMLMVWTVNEPEHMIECVRWGVDVILTDFTRRWLDMRDGLQADYDKTVSRHGRIFLWTTPGFYTPVLFASTKLALARLEKIAGPFDQPYMPATVEV